MFEKMKAFVNANRSLDLVSLVEKACYELNLRESQAKELILLCSFEEIFHKSL